MNDEQYLLFCGQGVGGRGWPEFQSMTSDWKKALRFCKRCHKNPHSFGYVIIATQSTKTKVSNPKTLIANVRQLLNIPSKRKL